jgi:hypothetical protein
MYSFLSRALTLLGTNEFSSIPKERLINGCGNRPPYPETMGSAKLRTRTQAFSSSSMHGAPNMLHNRETLSAW